MPYVYRYVIPVQRSRSVLIRGAVLASKQKLLVHIAFIVHAFEERLIWLLPMLTSLKSLPTLILTVSLPRVETAVLTCLHILSRIIVA